MAPATCIKHNARASRGDTLVAAQNQRFYSLVETLREDLQYIQGPIYGEANPKKKILNASQKEKTMTLLTELGP